MGTNTADLVLEEENRPSPSHLFNENRNIPFINNTDNT